MKYDEVSPYKEIEANSRLSKGYPHYKNVVLTLSEIKFGGMARAKVFGWVPN